MSSAPTVIEPTVRDSAAEVSPGMVHDVPFTADIAPITDSAAEVSPDMVHDVPFTAAITWSVGDAASVG